MRVKHIIQELIEIKYLYKPAGVYEDILKWRRKGGAAPIFSPESWPRSKILQKPLKNPQKMFLFPSLGPPVKY